jgi:two-component system, OmpR family, alkaline phosphatase synthesis response regulator PhoP
MFKFTQAAVPFRILIADADEKVSASLREYLLKEGFEVFTVHTGKQAIETSKEIVPHLILTEIVFEEMDGIELCNEIKEIPGLQNTLIIFYTSRSEDYTQIAAFNAGADDYLLKPIKPRVLASRLKALLKRVDPGVKHTEFLDAGRLKIDLEHFVVMKENERLNLPKKEFKLLSLLATKPGKVFSRETIIKEVWGDGITTTDRTIDVHIRRLREKIGDNCITTIKGIGYKLDFKCCGLKA